MQEVITVVGLPMFILVFIMMFALYRGLSYEDLSKVRVAGRVEAGGLGAAK